MPKGGETWSSPGGPQGGETWTSRQGPKGGEARSSGWKGGGGPKKGETWLLDSIRRSCILTVGFYDRSCIITRNGICEDVS